MDPSIPLKNLLHEIRACKACESALPLGAKPILRMSEKASILLVGQAPGTRVHNTGIPWNDPSGDRLRVWMGLSDSVFYDESKIAIVPMGFCYPGKGKSGDLPPRKECAELWRARVHQHMPNIRLTLLVGQYAQNYYLSHNFKTLTEVVAHWQEFGPGFFPLPHPSPRNNLWIKRNPWFDEVIEALRGRVVEVLAGE